ncbi:MAG: alpha/beta hydrolase [Planctomycetaceae bacterium]|nr:alpha/beta hydrolase [Planctomycetaceae bacterium]
MPYRFVSRVPLICHWFLFVTVVIAELETSLPTANAAPPLSTTAAVVRDLNYAGNESPHHTLDLYLPEKQRQNSPLVVWIHGGGWRKGSKDFCPIRYLADEGFTVASINYRLTDVAPFPAQIHDCKAAIRFLRAQAKKHGYDAGRIGVGGGSAGGHLVSLLGTTGDMKELEGDVGKHTDVSSRVQAVLNLYGPTDLHMIVNTVPTFIDLPSSPLYHLFGQKPTECIELVKLASPVLHVTKDDAPVLMMHGSEDRLVHLIHSEKLRDAYAELKLPAELIVFDGASHGGLRFFDEAARKAQTEFFRKYLSGE